MGEGGVGQEQPPADGAAEATVEARRFCGACGTPRELNALLCRTCADRAAAAVSIANPAISFSSEGAPIASALALYFVFLAGSMIGIIILLSTEDDRLGAPVDLWISVINAVIVLAWTARSWHDTSPGLRRTGGLIWYPLAAVGAIFTFLIASGVVAFVGLITNLPEVRYSDYLLEAGYGWIGVILLVCVQPAIIEELAFRGVILSGMARVMAVGDAIIVSAMMFMIIHLSALSFPHLLLIGLVLGWMRVHTGSLYPGMVLHFVHNGLVVWEEAFGGRWLPW